jgi:DNA-binding NarL/FixJ family response regulator
VAVHIAVVDPLPMYQQGVAAVLSAAGHTVETPADVLEWVRRGQQAVVLLTLECEQDWELLEHLRDPAATHVVIAVIEEESVVQGVRAVRAGAQSVLLRRVTVGALRRTVEATIDGQAVMPAAVAAALGPGAPDAAQRFPSPEQRSWLRQLADGSTVAQLAGQVGYSEREMFRLLQSLYKKMGVRTRIQAIIRAQDQGWLRAETGRSEAERVGRG